MKNQLFKQFFKSATLFFLLTLIFSSYSCKSYYQVDKENKPTADRLNEFNNRGKYLIIHDNTNAYKLSNFEIKDDILTGITKELPNEHRLYTVTFSDKKNHYKPKNKSTLNEVHIYTALPIQLNQNVNIPINSISKIEIYNKNKNATASSWVFGTLGVGAGAILLTLGALILIYIIAGS